MSSELNANPNIRVCAICGQSKSLTEFDKRFINKPTRVACAACRQEKRDKEEAAMAPIIEAMRREQERREADVRLQQEHIRRYNLRKRRLAKYGFNENERYRILHIHSTLEDAGQTWASIVARFHALRPPYIGAQERKYTSQKTRELIYTSQAGRCYYCGRAMLPLAVWKLSGPDNRSTVVRLALSERNNKADSGIPELDHLTPVSRGGPHSLDNLCYACRQCNQTKGVRTAEEFAQLPNDAISKLALHPGEILSGLALEARGYDFDADTREPS